MDAESLQSFVGRTQSIRDLWALDPTGVIAVSATVEKR
jgi:hypothetical protein